MIPTDYNTASRGNAQFQIMMNNQRRLELISNPDSLSVYELYQEDRNIELANVQLAFKAKVNEKMEEEREKWLQNATAMDLGIMSLYG